MPTLHCIWVRFSHWPAQLSWKLSLTRSQGMRKNVTATVPTLHYIWVRFSHWPAQLSWKLSLTRSQGIRKNAAIELPAVAYFTPHLGTLFALARTGRPSSHKSSRWSNFAASPRLRESACCSAWTLHNLSAGLALGLASSHGAVEGESACPAAWAPSILGAGLALGRRVPMEALLGKMLDHLAPRWRPSSCSYYSNYRNFKFTYSYAFCII